MGQPDQRLLSAQGEISEKHWKNAVISFLAIGALIGAGLWLRAAMTRPWIEAVPGVRLDPSRPILHESDVKKDSAFHLIRLAASATSRNEVEEVENIKAVILGSATPEELAKAEAALEANVTPLEAARRSAAVSDAQMPTVTSFADPTDYLMPMTALASLLRISAARAIVAGDDARAFDELIAGLRLMDHLSRGGVLINRLVEITGETGLLQSIRWTAIERNTPEPLLRKTIAALLEMDEGMEPWSELYRYERLCVRDAIASVFKSGSFTGMTGLPAPMEAKAVVSASRLLGSGPDITARNFENIYTHFIWLADRRYDPKAERALMEQIVESGGSGWKIAVTRDPLGHVLARIVIPSFDTINNRHRTRLADLRATAIVLALRLFVTERSHPPATLAELVPAFLPRVPVDPFDEKPLRYIAKPDGSWRIYSIGPNQQDERGYEPPRRPTRYEQPGDLAYPSSEPADERAKLNAKP